MPKTYRPYAPRQSLLLPPSLLDWLPQGHLALFILELVEELDLRPIYAYYERESRGFPPHHPKMMVALLLYGYAVGVPSSRRIETKTREDIAFRVVAGNQSPDHTRISEFRRIHGAHLAGLFLQVLKLCQKAGLVKLGQVAIDGTKLKANASKHKAMSYKRMKEEEQKLEEKVRGLLAEAEAVDAEEDARYGKGRRGDELPEEFQRAATRLEKIRAAKRALEEEAKAANARDDDDDDDDDKRGGSELPSHRVPAQKDGQPTGKAQRNFVDPESRIMKTNDGFVQGYNAQAAVDEHAHIIVAQALTNQPPDPEHLVPVLHRIADNLDALPDAVTADNGYFSEDNIAQTEALGVTPYIATGRLKHGESPPPVRGRPRANASAKEKMMRRLRTKQGKAIYSRRKCTVEPVFGCIKAARGFRQLLRRGVTAAREEWAFICATHNLLKLHRAALA